VRRRVRDVEAGDPKDGCLEEVEALLGEPGGDLGAVAGEARRFVDDDGAVLIPAALVEDVVRVAPEQERMETWIMDEVSNGAKLPGLYPPNEDNLKRYKDWASGR